MTWHLLAANSKLVENFEPAASTCCSGDNKEKLPVHIHSQYASDFCHDRKSALTGAIKRQIFPMVTHVFENSNLSQQMFAIDTWRAVIYSLGHGRKHMLAILPTILRQAYESPLKIPFYHSIHLFEGHRSE